MTKKDETIDEAQKADESKIVEESPASEESKEVDADVAETNEELPPEQEGEEVESEPTGDEEAEASPEGKGRKTAESRIKELVAEKKQAEEKAADEEEKSSSLAEQVEKLTARRPEASMEDFNPQQEQQDEITYEELMRRQQALIELNLARERNANRVNAEAADAIKAHPELDPDSDSFDKELSESISQATMAKLQADPNVKVTDFVDRLMKPYKRSLEKQAEGQKEALAKQASKQAMRPSQVQEKEKPFSELSIEEMEEKLGTVYR